MKSRRPIQNLVAGRDWRSVQTDRHCSQSRTKADGSPPSSLYDEQGRLSGLAEAKISPMLGLDGQPISGKALGDAESLVIDSGKSETLLGNAYVGFERAHRIWRYDLEKIGSWRKARTIADPETFRPLEPERGYPGRSNFCRPPTEAANHGSWPSPKRRSIRAETSRHSLRTAMTYPGSRSRPRRTLQADRDMARLPNGDILLLRTPLLDVGEASACSFAALPLTTTSSRTPS